AGVPRAAAPRPPGPSRQTARWLDRGTRRLSAPRGRASNLVHPRAFERLDLAQWLAVPAGSAHVRSLPGPAEASGVADSRRAQRPAKRIGAGRGRGLAAYAASILSGSRSA